MKMLLDSHSSLWSITGDDRLSQTTEKKLLNAQAMAEDLQLLRRDDRLSTYDTKLTDLVIKKRNRNFITFEP